METLPRKRDVITLVVSLLVFGSLSFLLLLNYRSQLKLQEIALGQLRADTEKRAVALSYFFSERKNDLQNLVEYQALAAYFANQALGMSMKYGLWDSVYAIRRRFERFLKTRKLAGDRIYHSIAFVKEDGTPLVDLDPDSRGVPLRVDRLLRPRQRGPAIRLISHEGRQRILIVVPYWFKNTLQGAIIAEIVPETLQHHLFTGANGPSHREMFLFSQAGRLIVPPRSQGYPCPVVLMKRFPALLAANLVHFRESVNGKELRKMLALRVRVAETPFHLVMVVPRVEVLGTIAPELLLFIMGTICILLTLGTVFLVRVHTRNLLLRVRLEEASKAKLALEQKNRELKTEVFERRQTERALRESEQRFRELAELLPETIFESDPEGRLTYLNQTAFTQFGYSHDDLDAGLKVFDLLAAEDQPRIRQAIQRIPPGGQTGLTEYTMKRKNGSTFPAILNMTLVTRDGRPAGVRGVVIDVTVTKQLQHQLQHAQKMEAIGTLAGGIAHDFNNLLQAMHGYAEILQLRLEQRGDGCAELREIMSAAKRGGELTQQLLTFSRKIESNLRPVLLNEQIRKTYNWLVRTIPKMISVRLDLEEDLHVVLADPVQIEQVLLNLIVNAKDSMPDGGEIEIRTAGVTLDADFCRVHPEAQEGGYVLMSVTDTGQGMSAEDQEHMFEPFFTTKEQGRGTGLGLAMVYGIVQNHHGFILCESRPGAGTRFDIYFPLVQSGEDCLRSDQPLTTLKGGEETVLVVDDERYVREFIKEMLENFGYRVILAASGEQALEIYTRQGNQIDLVILDIMMPGLGGYKCLREILKLDGDARVLMASGWSPDLRQRELLRLGAAGFIRKPFDSGQLLKAIRKILHAAEP